MFNGKCEKLVPAAKFALRLVVAAVFIKHGWDKIQDPQMVIGMLTNLKYPMPGFLAWVLILTEIVFGAALALGLLTHLIALPLMFDMLMAFLTVHLKTGWNGGTELVVLLFFALGYFAVSGAGKCSLDAKLFKSKK